MPKLLNTNLEQHTLAANPYGFSATRIEDLGASEYTLATLVVDSSGSTCGFRTEMVRAIKDVVKSCKFSPRAANLLLRLVEFDSSLREIHGFKLLSQCNESDYDGCLTLNGCTSLYDAADNSVGAMIQYGKDLSDQDFDVNAITIVLTDGGDNTSKLSPTAVKKTFQSAVQSESLESLVSILVGVNIPVLNIGAKQDELNIAELQQEVTLNASATAQQELDNFRRVGEIAEFGIDAGFTQYIGLNAADSKTLARLAEFVSKSISSQSQSLGSGGGSQSLSF